MNKWLNVLIVMLGAVGLSFALTLTDFEDVPNIANIAKIKEIVNANTDDQQANNTLIEANANTNAGALITTSGLGAVSNGVVTVVEYGDGLDHKTVITFVSCVFAIADGGFEDDQTLYTFPAGHIKIEGCVIDAVSTLTSTNFNATANDLFNLSIGSTAADNGDGTLSTTEVNMIASTSIDTTSGTVLTNDFTAGPAVDALLDGTTTAAIIVANMGVPAANDNGANTNGITGTLTVYWKELGDY